MQLAKRGQKQALRQVCDFRSGIVAAQMGRCQAKFTTDTIMRQVRFTGIDSEEIDL